MTKPWKRLAQWLPGGEPTNDGDVALRALADVAEVRRSLDQAELSAVRMARRHGRSWTEIATMLAITRQSAWERWRDLDGDAEPASTERARIVEPAANELAGRVRRRRTVAVPDLIGLSSADALGILTRAGLDAVSATPGIELREGSDELRPAVVVRQYPDPGTRIQTASAVKLWLERGDGDAGVREPRRPTTPPRAAQARRDERTEEAVG
jgi:PASTA domain